MPVVVAGNREAAPTAAATLAAGGRTVTRVENVLPAIGTIEPAAARSAIRAAFLDHVIGGKHLTADPAVLAGVIGPTPDLVLTGVEVLARVAGCDVLVVDVGGGSTERRIERVQVVTSRHRYDTFFGGDRTPRERTVRAEVVVPRDPDSSVAEVVAATDPAA